MPFRLAMLGIWHVHTAGIVRQVAAHPDEFSLAGVFDPDPRVVAAQGPLWRSLIPGLRVFDAPDDLLREPLDGVVVEGRVHENLRWATLALEAGYPVLLEKPPGDNLDEYRRLIDLARAREKHVQVIYLFRYLSAVQELLSRARNDRLGPIYEFRGRLPKRLDEYGQYVAELGRYRGGIFFEMAGHLVDLLVTLCGRPKQILPLLRHHHAAGPHDFVDNGAALFECDGALGIIEVPALESARFARRVEVYGTAGACVIPHLGSGHEANSPVERLEVFERGASEWSRLELPAATLQISDLREFAAVVRGEKPPDFSMEHDLLVQECLLRACGMA
ncbi:MAG: Gfo/Idh/MocA family protein [Planctomycetaceae bacterium]